MRKSVLSITYMVIVFGFVISSIPSRAKAGTTYLKEIEATIVYGTTGEVGVQIAGMDVPIGLAGVFGTDPVGVLRNCSWAFATCDNSQVGYKPI